jgi:hypothetical protein
MTGHIERSVVTVLQTPVTITVVLINQIIGSLLEWPGFDVPATNLDDELEDWTAAM